MYEYLYAECKFVLIYKCWHPGMGLEKLIMVESMNVLFQAYSIYIKCMQDVSDIFKK